MSPGKTIRFLLAGGDRRSIGKSNAVAALVLQEPKQFGELIECLWDADPLIAMRAADAAEKASRSQPRHLAPYKAVLLGLLAEAIQKELRWHLAIIIPRLQLTPCERLYAVQALRSYIKDRSSIVKTFAMQGLFDLADQDSELRGEITELLRIHTRAGTPAMRARGRNLLRELERR